MNVNAQISVGEWIDKLTTWRSSSPRFSNATGSTMCGANMRRCSPPRRRCFSPTRDRRGCAARLKAVNAELWRIEDEIRLKERARAFDEEFIALARAVYVTNDRRAALKREINLVSRSGLVEEKSYAGY